MHIKPFQAIYPKVGLITSPDSFFGTVKQEYPEYYKSGFFEKASQEGIYVYQITEPGRVYTGLIACAAIEDYLNGLIKKHEHTLAEKEQAQLHLLLRRKAMVKPILLTYPPVEAIEAFLHDFVETNEPFYSFHFEAENQIHRFYEIKSGEQIQLIQALFDKFVPHTYIADGHHRSSVTAIMAQRSKDQAVNPYEKLFCAFFATSELDIHDYNRVIEGLEEVSPTYFMARLSHIVNIEPVDSAERPRQKHEMVLFLNREWYRLNWKPSVLKQYQGDGIILDVKLLDELILRNILDIKDTRTDNRIKYVEGRKGVEGVKDKALKNESRIGFFLYPVQMDDFMHIADLNKVLPPKSTWFEPRMRNGLIVQGF
jgi:uncharacterized protein (DUF1015 family)